MYCSKGNLSGSYLFISNSLLCYKKLASQNQFEKQLNDRVSQGVHSLSCNFVPVLRIDLFCFLRSESGAEMFATKASSRSYLLPFSTEFLERMSNALLVRMTKYRFPLFRAQFLLWLICKFDRLVSNRGWSVVLFLAEIFLRFWEARV